MPRLLHVDHANTTTTALPDGGVCISIPIRLRMRGGRKEIVLPADIAPDIERSPANESLVTALVRAYCWNEQLRSGRFQSIPELAAAVKFERTYVSRILELVNLAPDIAQAILDGNEPDGFTLDKLRQGIPVLWEDQRKQFGFQAPQ